MSSSKQVKGDLILGDYKVGIAIGEGTFGKVRLGVHLPTNEKVAIKTLQKQKIADQSDIQRITRQIAILKQLHHPNVIQLYQIIETKQDINLIMEYASGGEIFDHIVKKKRLEESQAVHLMQQLLAGIEYIHKLGVVHRDLKPQNLLLDEKGNIKIVDFGLSNQYKRGEKLKTACGSPCYAAPQMIAGKRYECLGVDIWSSGIILYAMLCGYLPFEDPNTNNLYKKILSGDFTLPKKLSPLSRSIIPKILNTNPETRYSIQQIRSSEWYNQTGRRYTAKGTLPSEGALQVDENVVAVVEGKGVRGDVRGGVRDNRHNAWTAYYYLMKKKMDRDPAYAKMMVAKARAQPQQARRSQSPIIYRPNTPQIIANRPTALMSRPKGIPQDRDNSLNTSQIINSLVSANKDKLTAKGPHIVIKDSKLDYVQDFRHFPAKRPSFFEAPSPQKPQNLGMINQALLNSRRNSINDNNKSHNTTLPLYLNHVHPIRPQEHPRPSIKFSQTPPSSTTVPLFTSFGPMTPSVTLSPRNHLESPVTYPPKQNYSQFNHNGNQNVHIAQTLLNENRFQEMNKKGQELSEQLKMISVKIDNSINQLRKRNTSMSNSSTMTTPKQEQFVHKNNQRFRTQNNSPLNTKVTFFQNGPRPSAVLPHISAAQPLQSRRYSHSAYTYNTPPRNPPPPVGVIAYQHLQQRQQPYVRQGPKAHVGMFNADCLFRDQPKTLLTKIQGFFRKEFIGYGVKEGFRVDVHGKLPEEWVEVQSMQGVEGFSIVSLGNTQAQWCERLLNYLKK